MTPRVKQIILFLHLHKGAGTFLCNMAKTNNMRVGGGGNCLVQVDQRCCGGDTREEQYNFTKSTNFDFVANENYMYANLDPTLFIHVTILRDSWSRYVSHFGHVKRAYGLKDSLLTWIRGQPDNWNVRHICGTRCMLRPKFGLSREDYAYTRARLRMFRHVIRLPAGAGNLSAFHRDVAALCRGLKWSKCNTMRRVNAGQQSESQLQPPWQLTALDDCLFSDLPIFLCPNALRYLKLERMVGNPCGAACTVY